MSNNFEKSSKFTHKTSIFEINLVKVAGNCFFIFACIPWVNFGLNDYDSQPWAFILSCIYLLLVSKKIYAPKNSFIILFLVILGLTFTIFNTTLIVIFDILRAVIMYLTIPIMYIAFYNYFVRHKFPLKLFIFINFVWILFGFVEMLYPEFVSSISQGRRDPSRGQTSLAPEATFFGIYLFFSSWILIEANKLKIEKKIQFMLLINFLFVVFLTKSSMVILFYSIVILILFIEKFRLFISRLRISKRNIITFLKYFFIVSFLLIFFWDLLDGSRVKYLLNKLEVNSILQIMIMDESINSRTEAVYFSIVGAFNNFLLPGGLDTFIEMRRELLEKHDLFNYFLNKQESNKIMSWIGSFLYELGIFGLLAILMIFNAIYKNFRGSLIYYGLIFFILLSAVPVAFPLVPMLFALMVYNDRDKDLNKDQ